MAWTVYSARFADARISSDAAYRILGGWISARLQDLGWALQSDSGDIDWGTATRPGSPTAHTKGGYEIRKSTVTSADIYAKITYGCGFGAGVSIGLWLTSGETTDGAGAIGGDVATEAQMGTAVGNTSPYDGTWIVAGDAGNFVIGQSDGTAANGNICGIQRTCDANGADTATGWYQYGMGYTTALFGRCQYVGFAGGAATADSNNGFGILYLPRTILTTSCVPCLPFYAQNGLTWAPMRDICGMFGGPGAALGEFDVPMYGSTKRYKGMILGTSSNQWGFTAALASTIGIRIS
jgi:hypothetical protein